MAVKEILVVDDSMSSRLVLRKMLGHYNVGIELVESVKDAMDYLTQHRPDAVFLDRYMPDVNGLQALKLLKENPKTSSIPVVMFTALGPEDDANDLIDQGAIGVLPKPFTDDALASMMKRLDEAKTHGVKSVRARQAVNREGRVDRRALEPVVQSMLDEALETRLMPLLNERINAIKAELVDTSTVSEIGPELTREIERATNEAVKPAVRLAVRQLGEQTSDEISSRLEDNAQLHNRKLNDRLSDLEQRMAAQLDELRQQPAEPAPSAPAPMEPEVDGRSTVVAAEMELEATDQDMTEYYLMDQAEPDQPEAVGEWLEEDPPTDKPRVDPDEVHYVGGDLPPLRTSDPRRRYAVVGVAAAVIAVVALFYLFRSLGA